MRMGTIVSARDRLWWWWWLILLPALTVAAVAFAGTPAAGASARQALAVAARRKYLECKAIFSNHQIEQALGGHAVYHKVFLQNAPGGEFTTGLPRLGNYKVFSPGSSCEDDWNYSNGVPKGHPHYSCGYGFAARWAVGYNAMPAQWRAFRAWTAANPYPLLPQPVQQRTLKLGGGSQAFVETSTTFCAPASGYPDSWDLYVYTKLHTILEIQIWPSTLQRLETLARYVIEHDTFL